MVLTSIDVLLTRTLERSIYNAARCLRHLSDTQEPYTHQGESLIAGGGPFVQSVGVHLWVCVHEDRIGRRKLDFDFEEDLTEVL